jgi:bacteriorhodopsin
MQNKDFLAIASTYIPQSYNWGYFAVGEILILAGAIKMMGTKFTLISDEDPNRESHS